MELEVVPNVVGKRAGPSDAQNATGEDSVLDAVVRVANRQSMRRVRV